MFKSLIDLGINGIRSLITNARVGKQVLASGATVTTQQSGSGSNVAVSSGGSAQIPAWLVPVAWGVGGLLVIGLLVKLIFKK